MEGREGGREGGREVRQKVKGIHNYYCKRSEPLVRSTAQMSLLYIWGAVRRYVNVPNVSSCN